MERATPIPMRSLRSIAAAVAIGWCITPQVSAQIPTAPGVQPDSTALAIVHSTRSRLMHGREQPRFSPFTSWDRSLDVDSIRAQGGHRRLYLTLGDNGYGRGTALVDIDLSRRVVDTRVAVAPRTGPFADSAESAFLELGRRQQLAFNEIELWDVVPSLPSTALRVGLVWTDTIARTASDGLFLHSITGTRVSRVVRDTVVSGRRLWVVRDSAAIRYEHTGRSRERTLDTTVVESRIGTGTVRGVHLMDSDLRLFRWRVDTTRVQGEAVLQYPDGRSFRTPARYEEIGRWMLYDGRAYQTFVAERDSASMRESEGLVRVPSNALEQRLQAGDTVARDSLVREWRRTSDPDTAERIFSALRSWLHDKQSYVALTHMRIALGDTVFWHDELARMFGKEIDTSDVPVMLGFMNDPSIPWAFHRSGDALYERLAEALTTFPPAVLARGERAPCVPAACRLLADQWRTAREPRLRDLGLVALFATDPRRWGDTVLAIDVRQHPLLASSKALAMGVDVMRDAASNASLPPPGSDARAWRDWTEGVDPQHSSRDVSPSGMSPEFRVEQSQIVAIRMYSARTGRDVVGELRQGYRSATSESARLIFGSMLQGLGELQLNETDVADAFTSRVPERIALARGALVSNLGDSATRMPDAKAAALVDRLIASVVNSTPLWPNMMAGPRGSVRDALPGLHGASGPIFFDAENIPESVRAKWAGQVAFISKSELQRRNPREGGIFYFVDPVRVWGRFARVHMELSERRSRAADAVPQAYAAGATYYLMELNGEWVVVSRDAWIT